MIEHPWNVDRGRLPREMKRWRRENEVCTMNAAGCSVRSTG
jgi:hypothetical protein